MFESAPQPNEPGGKLVSATDKRFFWLALYAQPALWVALAIVAIVKFEFIWLTLVGALQSYITASEGLKLIQMQSLLWSSLSPTRWLSRDATSLAKQVVFSREASTLALWPEILVELWFPGCSTGVSGVERGICSAYHHVANILTRIRKRSDLRAI